MKILQDPAKENRATVYPVNDDAVNQTGIILPIHGYGLWSTLYGFVAPNQTPTPLWDWDSTSMEKPQAGW